MIQCIGGEPTTHLQLPRLIRFAYEKHVQIEVFSNLVHISPTLWTIFQGSQVSLATSFYDRNAAIHDQMTTKPGSQQRTLANIRTCLQLQIPLRVGMIQMHDEQSVPGKELRHWMQTCYGKEPYLPEAPVWPSLSCNSSRGNAISARSISNLCLKWLEMSQVHALRHTFAKTMEEAGAKVNNIQARLGHTLLAVTGRYLARLHHSENRHLSDLSRLYEVPLDTEQEGE